MQAIILAAGMGKRLKELTQDNTKCMVKVDGISLIERALGQLDRLGLSKIVIVVGYEGQKLIDYIGTLAVQTPVVYINNDIYDKTNNIYSLALAKEYLLKEDTLLLESDIIFEEAVLRALVDDPRDTLALVDKYERWMDGTVVKLDEEDRIIEFVPGKKFKFSEQDSYYKTVNLYKFSREFARNRYVPFLEAYQKALGNNEYYEQVLSVISILDEPVIKAKRLHGERWYEIDDVQDLDIATTLFAESEDERVSLLGARYGGYWRYPKLLDFCYLVNPYFPPQKLKDELQANFDVLLTQYPSGMRVNALLAAKNFAVRPEHIVVGNGAAELIKEVIWSEETKTEENPLIVCVDAGHGGKDNGSDYKGRYEKDDNLKLAQAVAAYLADKNVKVVMTRSDDTFLRLSERCGIANQSGADYMLSLHRNDGEGNGVETWISASGSEETDALANHIMEALDTAGIQRNRGVKKGTQTGESSNYYINVHSDMPSCIVEMGFINDASDNQLFDEKLDAYAAAIGDAVLATAETYRANKVTDGNGQGTGEAGSGAGDGQGTNHR